MHGDNVFIKYSETSSQRSPGVLKSFQVVVGRFGRFFFFFFKSKPDKICFNNWERQGPFIFFQFKSIYHATSKSVRIAAEQLKRIEATAAS